MTGGAVAVAVAVTGGLGAPAASDTSMVVPPAPAFPPSPPPRAAPPKCSQSASAIDPCTSIEPTQAKATAVLERIVGDYDK